MLVIAPGFGFLANPAKLRCIEVAGFTVVQCLAPNPQDAGFSMGTAIKGVLHMIETEAPHAILCASKGGHTWLGCGVGRSRPHR